MNTKETRLDKALSLGAKNLLIDQDIEFLNLLESDYRLSLQSLRKISIYLADSRSWNNSLLSFSQNSLKCLIDENPKWQKRQQAEHLIKVLETEYNLLLGEASRYDNLKRIETRADYKFKDYQLKSNFFHVCPAKTRSDEGVCCDLQVLDVVENCAFGCTYCILQSRFGDAVIKTPTNLKEKLAEIKLDPNKQIRIGTGQSSDSLHWGNRNNILTDLFEFTKKNPQIILELKTKSANIAVLLEMHEKGEIPPNVCCSWSLNPEIIATNEEHGAATVDARLKAARKLADEGIKVAFHIHPMMYFDGWEKAYTELIERIVEMFKPEEVLWFTLGTITLPKGVDEMARQNWKNSKILQMATELTVDYKTTYAKEYRLKLYHNAIKALGPWIGKTPDENKVVIYMCMEFKDIWQEVMGYYYDIPEQLNDAIMKSAFAKIN